MSAKNKGTVVYREGMLKDLILYIAQKTENDPFWDQIKFNKALFYSDFAAYATFGQPITGATYIKKDLGPVLQKMLPIRAKLVKEKKIVAKKETLPTGVKIDRLLPLKTPVASKLSAEQLAIVNFVVETLQAHNSREVSERSHAVMGWKLATLGEKISYATVTLPNEPMPIAPNDIAHGHKLAAKMNKEASQAA